MRRGVDCPLQAGAHFVVHSPMLAVKSLTGRQVYVTLTTGTSGEILETYGQSGSRGLVSIRIRDECLFTWKRDLEDRAEILREQEFVVPRKQMSSAGSHEATAHETATKKRNSTVAGH